MNIKRSKIYVTSLNAETKILERFVPMMFFFSAENCKNVRWSVEGMPWIVFRGSKIFELGKQSCCNRSTLFEMDVMYAEFLCIIRTNTLYRYIQSSISIKVNLHDISKSKGGRCLEPEGGAQIELFGFGISKSVSGKNGGFGFGFSLKIRKMLI